MIFTNCSIDICYCLPTSKKMYLYHGPLFRNVLTCPIFTLIFFSNLIQSKIDAFLFACYDMGIRSDETCNKKERRLIMAFLGRTREQKRLLAALNSEEMQIILMYGRRRVGKSRLIRQVLSETAVPAIYYECKQTSEKNNLDSLVDLYVSDNHLPPLRFDSIEAFLTYYFQQSFTRPSILVLDEYPYLRETVRGMDSILQSLIDRYRDNAHLKLILCGSYVDTMTSLLEKENPLFGRIDMTMNLKPMDYLESSLFYSDYSSEDKVRVYSVFGGIPYYNQFIDTKKSVRQNIIDLIASPDARLANEIEMYLLGELSKISNANIVFETLARGISKFHDIYNKSHLTSTPVLSEILKKLSQMDVVEKVAPINDEHNRKKAGYYISDNMSLFYYKYVYPRLSQMAVMDPEVFFDRFIAEDFENKYVPLQFEKIARQYLIRENRSGRLEEPFFKIGKYYYDLPQEHRHGEFHIVTEDDKGYIFYEVKFRKDPVSASMIDQEISQVQETGLSCYKYGFLSRSGFQKEIYQKDNLILISLEKIYATDSV